MVLLVIKQPFHRCMKLMHYTEVTSMCPHVISLKLLNRFNETQYWGSLYYKLPVKINCSAHQ